jgi:single-stranded-DNA-specific exonuclease
MEKTSSLGKVWKPREIDERKVYKYIQDFSLSDLLARIIIARGINESQVELFLNPKIKHLLPDPFHLIDMEKACVRVADAVEAKQKITVLGDYDVDGATSSALLIRLLKQLNAKAEVYIPDRVTEGYGPSASAFQKFKDNGSSLAITVDCGITAFEAVDYANEIGLDVIILDHHLSDVKIPAAIAVVNPNRIDETSEYKYLAAVGVSFLFAVGLVKTLKNRGYFNSNSEPDLLSLLDLVALGTTCDMMPIIGLNRAYIVQGLKVLSNQKNLGLKLLSEFGKIDSLPNSYHLGFVIGPRINAGGRVGKSYLGSHLLSTEDEILAQKYALELERYNEERKVIEQQVLDEAIIMAESQLHKNYIIVSSEKWHQGVIGIVAGKLKERYQKPVAAISIEGDVGKASCRSVRGIDMGRKIVEAKKRNILLTGGGHSMAAGFTLSVDKIDELIAFFDESMEQDSTVLTENNTCYYDAEISPNGVTIELAKEIEKLEPYGNGNSEPIVKISKVYVLRAAISNNRHITCMLAPDKESVGSKPIKAICFNCIGSPLGDALLSEKPLTLSILGNIKVNNWQGYSTAQVNINDAIID